MLRFLLICFLSFLLGPSCAVWTKFDFVRTKENGWGSEGRTPYKKFSLGTQAGGKFGYSVANVGDIDGNGVDDIAVGAMGETVSYDGGATSRAHAGGVYVLLMNSTGDMMNYTHIYGARKGEPVLDESDQFGYSLAPCGDLDKDGIPDFAVGAPGSIVSSVYVLFMHRNATVKKSVLIRGQFIGSRSYTNTTTTQIKGNHTVLYLPPLNSSFNGPPIHYGSGFGVSLANIGDFNGDGNIDLAVGSIETGSGIGSVYILFLNQQARVLNYTRIYPGYWGAPDINPYFTNFGASIVAIGDINNDTVTDLAIGASKLYDAGSLNIGAGAVIVCLMLPSGYVNTSQRISEFAQQDRGKDFVIPNVPYDECGASLATIGDINLDTQRQHYPEDVHKPPRPSVNDLLMGCPQSNSGAYPGRFMMVFLSTVGAMAGFTVLPASTDEGIAPELELLDQFGQSLAGYWDVDGNGLKEVLVGSPGDQDGNGTYVGAFYIVFLRRRRYHAPRFPFVRFISLVTILPWFCCTCMCTSVAYFFWYFRRLPDVVETIVKDSGMEYDPKKPRRKYQKKPGVVYCDEYTL